MVYHDQERIEAGGGRKVGNKIAGDLLEGARGGGFDWGKWRYGGVCVGLVLLAGGTAFYVFSDIGREAGPPELGGDQLTGFKVPGVSRCFMVVTTCEDSVTNGIIIRDVYAALVSEDSRLVLPVREAGAEGERDRTIHRLEGLEYKGIIGRGGLNMIGEGSVDDMDEEGGRK